MNAGKWWARIMLFCREFICKVWWFGIGSYTHFLQNSVANLVKYDKIRTKSEFQTRQTRLMNPSLEEGEEDGGAEVGRDGAGHRQVGARDEPLYEGGHYFCRNWTD